MFKPKTSGFLNFFSKTFSGSSETPVFSITRAASGSAKFVNKFSKPFRVYSVHLY